MEHTTSIEVLAKTTAENLRIKNAEFLAKYPTDDSQIDYYTELAQKVFDEFQIDGTHDKVGVRKNVATWFNNKRSLMELFRKHPYWNEEAKAIVFIQDELREVDYLKARSELANLGNYVCNKYSDGDWDKVALGLYWTLCAMHDEECKRDGVITEDFLRIFNREARAVDIPKSISRMLKVGTKITKLAHKCFTEWKRPNGKIVNATTLVDDHKADDRTYNSFDKIYARFADTLSELVIKKITLVSLHFCDFMTMSNGNSWSSCHFINSNNIFHETSTSSYSGCYKQGCLSYALDCPSFLLYTLPNTYKGEEYYRQQKINRMCCQYEEGILITGKCYPDNEDYRITRYRQMLQLILSTIEDVPNLWTFSRKVDRIEAFVETADGAAHYRDYESSGQKPTISMCKHRIDLDHMLTIGHRAYCVHCGDDLSSCDEKWLQCERHRRKPICNHCGCHIDLDNAYDIGNAYYCEDCAFWCDEHNRWEVISRGKNEITLANGNTITVCNERLSRYYLCDGCGKWHSIRNCYYLNDKRYCDNCREDLKSKGEWPSTVEVAACTEYHDGDYILMTAYPERVNYFTTNEAMIRDFPNKIARIVYHDYSGWSNKLGFYITIDGVDAPWIWSPECFVGRVTGDVSDALLGKTLEEINQ
jgi:hypothetical protein